MEDKIFIRELFEKYHINQILKVKGKFLECLIDRIIYEYEIFDKGNFTTSRFSNINNFIVKSLIIVGGAFLSLLKSLKYKKNIRLNSEIIAVPYADHIVRFKRLQEISDVSIDFIYPPIFHFDNLPNHLSTLKKQNNNVFLGSFSFQGIIQSLWIILRNYKSFKRCSQALDCHFESHTCRLPSIIILSILYRDFISSLIGKISDKKRIWLFDYDFDLKYIIFNEIIHEKRPGDTTVHIQHGSFTSYEDAYCNPLSDYSLCCSPREENIIKLHNRYDSQIIPLGAPLQSFIDENLQTLPNISYDILVLLTSTYEKNNTEKQIEFLKTIYNTNYKYLVRFRPASRGLDEIKLKPYLSNVCVSKDSTLQEDISRAKIIVSFSEDALYTAIRNSKKIIIITKADITKIYKFDNKSSNLIIIENFKDANDSEIKQLLDTYDECTYENDGFVLYNFGANSIPALHGNFMKIFNSIMQ